jgi:outer membrane protein
MKGMSVLFKGLMVLTLATSFAEAASVAPDSALATALAQIVGQPLHLSAAVDAALARSTPVQTTQAQLDATRWEVLKERGSFDPEVFAELKRSSSNQPTASPFSGADVLDQDQTSAQTGLRLRLPIGTELEASVEAIRQESNSTFAALDPQYLTTASMRFRQPLLEGFGLAGRKDLTAAERRMDAAQARYGDAVLSVQAQVERRYWNLYAAQRDLAVQMLVRDQAEVLLNSAQLRARAGLVSPVQVANAQVFLATQRLALLDQQEVLDQLSDNLAAFIDQRPEDAERFRPVDKPPHTFELATVEQVVADALEGNGVLKAVRADTEVFKSLASAANRDLSPRVDLLGAVGSNGLSGTGREVAFGSDTLKTGINGGYGDALSQALTRDFPTWEVGVSLSIPLGNREDRGEFQRLRAEVNRAEQQYAEAARNLEAQVRTEYRALQNGARRLELAREGVTAATEQVRIGLVEYHNGQTTAFELVRLGTDLATAQQGYSQALVRTARAAAALRYLTSGRHPFTIEP